MLTLNDGRKELYQWDTGRTATVDIECYVVHFANLKYGESLAVEVKVGKVAIPNKLLMSGEPIYCWAFVKDESGAYTKKEQTFAVIKRAKPSDYVYTETEVITIKTAVENALQEAKESGDFKGEKGETGATGPAGKDGANGKDGVDGKDGTSVTVSNVSESTEDGGNNVVTFSDGKTLTVKNGSKGSQGEKGDPTDVQQTTGQSTTAVMSQKATTDEINALKGDLANKLPKSPVNWEPWTAEEQAAARERIGIPGDYELIEEIVCDGKVSAYDRKLEPDGTPYAFRSIYVELEIQPSNVYSGVFFRAYDAGGTAVLYDGTSTTNKHYTSYVFAGCYAHSGFYCGWMVSTNGGESNMGGASEMRINKPQIVLSPIKRILINHNSGVFFDGDKIRIYGVRA